MSDDVKRAEECYRLEVLAPEIRAGADVILLPSSDEVVLTADFVSTSRLPDSLIERSHGVAWEVEAGEVLTIRINGEGRTSWTPPAESKLVRATAEGHATLEPRPGAKSHDLVEISKSVELRFLTPVSSSRVVGGLLDGYNIGEYPDPDDPKLPLKYNIESDWHKRHPERYRMPSAFYRVEKGMKDLKISPHLTLGHFTIDYPWHTLGMPQYIAVDMNLVEKIEDLMDLMRQGGRFPVAGVKAIYGFRPPAFNLGMIEAAPETTKKVPFSMHQFGRALDFIIDENGDDVMDDLNGDGKIDIHDAAVIMHYVNILDRRYREEGRWEKVGGAGLYDSHDFEGRVQTPYIHVDTRGFQREGGTLIRWPDNWPGGEAIAWGKL